MERPNNKSLDADLLGAGLERAGDHIQNGARTFKAFTQSMVGDLGEAIRPYLRSLYEAVRHDPSAVELAKGMTSAADIDAGRTQEEHFERSNSDLNGSQTPPANVIFTEDAALKAREILRKKLGNVVGGAEHENRNFQKKVAWAPSRKSEMIELGTILVEQGQFLTRPQYLAVLSKRWHALVNGQPEPWKAVDRIVDELVNSDLFPEDYWGGEPETAGIWLTDNPLVLERLHRAGLPIGTLPTPQVELPESRQVLEQERQHPQIAFDRWLTVLTKNY